MAEKTIVEKAAEAVGYGLAMAEDVAGSVKTAVGGAVTAVTDALKKAPVKKATKKLAMKAVAKTGAKKAPTKKAAAKKSSAKKSAGKKPAKKSVKPKKAGRTRR